MDVHARWRGKHVGQEEGSDTAIPGGQTTLPEVIYSLKTPVKDGFLFSPPLFSLPLIVPFLESASLSWSLAINMAEHAQDNLEIQATEEVREDITSHLLMFDCFSLLLAG